MSARFEACVKTSAGSYPVIVENGVLAEVGAIVADKVKGRRALVVSDSNVAPIYSQMVLKSLSDAGFAATLEVLPAGEQTKQLGFLERLWSAMHSAGLTRADVALALGGGVVGDITGFAAATWLRGIAVVQIPTSLLAFCDSAIGGKTAIDLAFGKNLAGAFHQPKAVIGDPMVLSTLPKREFSQGMAEVIKSGLIYDATLVDDLTQWAGKPLSPEQTASLIAKSAQVKCQVVTLDEKESSLRMILNFGHTIGHAVEKTLGYGAIPHGEAVAIGMVAACRLGECKGISPIGITEQVSRLLRSYSLPVTIADVAESLPEPNTIFEAMLSDKKKIGAAINFVLLEQSGKACIVPISPAELQVALPELLS